MQAWALQVLAANLMAGEPKALKMVSQHDPRYGGPQVRDWLLLALSVAFVAAGASQLLHHPEVGIPTLAFFGCCAAIAARTVLRKRRFAGLRLLTVEIVGGVKLRPSRARIALLGTVLLALSGVLLVYWHAGSLALVLSLYGIGLAGAALLVGLAVGYLPVGFLQFDPAGLTLGQRRAELLVPWDAIAAVAPGEFHDNPVLLLSFRDLNAVVVHPPQARGRVIASLSSNVAWVGAHAMIMTSHYGIDLPFLVAAIERYIADPEARAGLSVARLPASEHAP